MSLTHLTKVDPEARTILNALLPSENIRFGKPLLLPALSASRHTVGTAFDYLVRFEIQRRYAAVTSQPWVAEIVERMIKPIAKQEDTRPSPVVAVGRTFGAMDGATARRWISLVRHARVDVSTFVAATSPSRSDFAEIAAHALKLARIDVLFRAGIVDEKVGLVDPAEVEDCLKLLEAVPWEALVRGSPVLLNPTFGLASLRVDGADADLVAGNKLIDFKVVSKPVPREDLRQLAGYLILARCARAADPAFPEIEELVVYYARHCFPFVFPCAQFTSRPDFEEICERFFARADQVFGRRRNPLNVKNNGDSAPVSSPVSGPQETETIRPHTGPAKPSKSKARAVRNSSVKRTSNSGRNRTKAGKCNSRLAASQQSSGRPFLPKRKVAPKRSANAGKPRGRKTTS